MFAGLGPALRRQARRLVEDEGIRILEDHHLADELRFFFADRIALRLRPGRALWLGSGRRQTQLPGPGPARHDIEADLRHVPREPPVEADSVVVCVDGEDAWLGHRRAIS